MASRQIHIKSGVMDRFLTVLLLITVIFGFIKQSKEWHNLFTDKNPLKPSLEVNAILTQLGFSSPNHRIGLIFAREPDWPVLPDERFRLQGMLAPYEIKLGGNPSGATVVAASSAKRLTAFLKDAGLKPKLRQGSLALVVGENVK